jgi:hypothetical protein
MMMVYIMTCPLEPQILITERNIRPSAVPFTHGHGAHWTGCL